MNITKQKGLITELHCQLAFSNLGFTVCTPICEDSRYDFIVDINKNLVRIQCKTCSVLEHEEGIKFATRSCRSNTQTNLQREYTKDEIDYFYTYYNEKSYLIKVEETSSEKTLRFSNPQKLSNISLAEDYELEVVLKRDFDCDFQYNQINFISRKKYNCPKCGAQTSKEGSLCLKCLHLQQRIVERPSREILKKEIREMPFTQIGKKYNVTDNAIRKWCIAENLPSKKKDILAYSEKEWKEV